MPALNRGFASLTAQSHRHVGNRWSLCAIVPRSIAQDDVAIDDSYPVSRGVLRVLAPFWLRIVWKVRTGDTSYDPRALHEQIKPFLRAPPE
jgi:hypothetical protein